MKTRRLLWAFSVLPFFVSCQEKEKDLTALPKEMSITVMTEAIENGPELMWKENDCISVFDGKKNNEFTTLETGGQAFFSGIADSKAEAYRGLYPYVEGLQRYRGKVTLNLPAAQEAAKSSFDSKAYLAAGYMPNDGTNSIVMKNMFALLKVKVQKSQDVVSIQVKSNGGEFIAGEVSVGLFEEPTIEVGNTSSDVVAIMGDKLDGEYYIAVTPQTLSQGCTLTLTSSEELKYTKVISTEVVFERNKVYDFGSLTDAVLEPLVNPEPTVLEKTNILTVSFEPGEFNLLSDPGFETFLNQAPGFRSSWQQHSAAKFTAPHAGKGAITIENPNAGQWYRTFQVVALRPKTDFVYSAYVKAGGVDVYTGVQSFPSARNNEIAGNTWAPKDNWHKVEKIFNAEGDKFGDVFCGIWGGVSKYVSIDDVSVIPLGYDKLSMNPLATKSSGSIGNTSFDAITSNGRVVAWKGIDGYIRLAVGNAVIGGQTYSNVIAKTDAKDINGKISISRFFKAQGNFSSFYTLSEGEAAAIPNAAFVYEGKTYLHYYVTNSEIGEFNWTVAKSGFAISEDDGKTWKKASGVWSGAGNFAHAGFCIKDGNIYMVGTKAGRSDGGQHWENIYVAKCSLNTDFTDPANWEYFNGESWEKDNESASSNATLTVGSRSEPALIWNPKFNRFMMIYRSEIHGGLVYRDADSIDGFWSGEKNISNDDTDGKCYGVNVMEVKDNGDIVLIATEL